MKNFRKQYIDGIVIVFQNENILSLSKDGFWYCTKNDVFELKLITLIYNTNA